MEEARFVHYKTGYKEIDDEHYKLLMLTSEIATLYHYPSPDRETVNALMEKLRVKFYAHLAHEEEMMAAANYKWLAPHIKEHEKIRTKFDNMAIKLSNQGCTKSKEYVVSEFQEIFVNHMDHYDTQITL
jgi:hemerythrin-like metal-binding protein